MGLKESGLRGSLRSVSTAVPTPDSEANQKLVHRWVLDDVNGTVQDSIGDADGENNGVSSIDGNWVGESAGEGNGVDANIITSPLGDFGSKVDDGVAIALSISDTSTDNTRALGIRHPEEEADTLYLALQGDGEIRAEVSPDDFSTRFALDTEEQTFNDGAQYRIVFNIIDPSNNDGEIWANQSEESTVFFQDDGPSGFSNWSNDFQLFSWDSDLFWEGVIDDVCLFDEPLTASEIQSYDNPWE